MSKTTKWHTKAIYLLVVLVMALGLMPGISGAQDSSSAGMTIPPGEIVPEDIAYDVKGSTQLICIGQPVGNWTSDWWLEAGVNLTPDDVTVVAPDPDPGVKVKGTADNVTCIELKSMKRGDIHIYVDVVSAAGNYTLHTEKKWGELDHSVLDLDANKAGIQGPEELVTLFPDATGIIEEEIEDTVYATFLSLEGERTVGHAIVHWWLFADTDANQELIDDLMDHLAAYGGALDDNHWAAHGKYNTEELGDLIGVADAEPFDVIDYYANTKHANTNIFTWNEVLPYPAKPWYFQSETEDSRPGDKRGKTWATLSVNADALKVCQPERTMVVVLVSYPGGSDPTDDPYNGENIVIIEKGKKQFHKTAIAEVKTPQLRWAGEKIVLEKDWGVGPSFTEKYVVDKETGEYVDTIDLKLYAAIYSLEEGSIGNLEPVDDAAAAAALIISTPAVAGIIVSLDYLGLPAGAQQVICPLGGYYYDFTDDNFGLDWGGYRDTQVILATEMSGQADVNAALYEARVLITVAGYIEGGPPSVVVEASFNGPVHNYGFLVYFMEFEDVTLAEDITPADSLADVAVDEAADVAVRVRGFIDYNYTHLMATTREEKLIDLNNDGAADKILPAGRYVLPDDWWLIAETQDISLRPNLDLMDMADNDDITSLWELGPYDSDVRTTEPPGEAERPSIGPFNTMQQWSIEDMWITSATVPSSIGPFDAGTRNTVVPDGKINAWDAPMPQALVLFKITDYSANVDHSLTELDKGNLEGYGYVGKLYQSPFYAVEIPAHWQIPSGYNWMSWTRDPGVLFWYLPVQGPYDYWTDLELASIIANTHESPINDQDVEVYSDNHGIAGVTVEPLDGQGSVTLTATAEFPYNPKKGKYGPRVSNPIEIGSVADLNPHFIVSDYNVAVGEAVLFDPATTAGGTHPYTQVRWDWENDGVWDVTLQGSEAQNLAIQSHAYNAVGLYKPVIEVTDSSIPALIRSETLDSFITVGSAIGISWNCPLGGVALIAPNPGAGRPELIVAAPCDGITVSDGAELWGIYYLVETGPDAGTCLYYIPGFASNTLTQLEPNEMYYVVVSTACTLTIPQ